MKTIMNSERIEMIDKTIRILNGAIGRITSMRGDSVDYMNLKIHDLNVVRQRLIAQNTHKMISGDKQ